MGEENRGDEQGGEEEEGRREGCRLLIISRRFLGKFQKDAF
jgi:hypothetical protein